MNVYLDTHSDDHNVHDIVICSCHVTNISRTISGAPTALRLVATNNHIESTQRKNIVMKRELRKLPLNRETLLTLYDGEIGGVHGGTVAHIEPKVGFDPGFAPGPWKPVPWLKPQPSPWGKPQPGSGVPGKPCMTAYCCF
jgi:hypothetical protein